MPKDIKQTVTFDAAPGVIFETLMDARKHSAFTGAPAKVARKAGGAFSCYGGYITGHTLELVKDKDIVQAWRGKDWPKGAWSLVHFNLAKLKGGKTRLTLSHVGAPAGKAKHLAEGWRSHYWTPLKAALKAAKAPAAKAARPARAKKRASSPARARKR